MTSQPDLAKLNKRLAVFNRARALKNASPVIEPMNEPAKPKVQNLNVPAKKLLLTTWVLAILFAVLIALDYLSMAKQFYGIAGSQEKTINFQYPVEIVKLPVIEGKKVSQDETLLEVRRFDLASELAIIEERMSEITARKAETTASTIAEIKSLTSRKKSSLAKLDIEIAKLDSQLKLNQAWKSQLDKRATVSAPRNILVEELSGLKSQRRYIADSYQVTIDNLQKQIANTARPDDAKLAVLKRRKTELQRQAETLKVTAEFDGQVGSILFTQGEQIEKFEPILTLHSESASFIKGYIHEGVVNQVAIGQEVWINSINSHGEDQTIAGQVTSLGNRIIEYPLRLKRNNFVSAWGREVIVELKESSNLLLGEKVIVSLKKPASFLQKLSSLSFQGSHWLGGIVSSLKAAELPDNLIVPQLKPILHATKRHHNNLEASGIVWDEQLNTYWLVNDESDKLARFSVDKASYEEVEVAGLKITDLESISLAANRLYLLASLSPNKVGKSKNKRNKFVELSRHYSSWQVEREVDLLEALQKRISAERVHNLIPDRLAEAILHQSIDVEAHQVIGSALYLGFKSPQSESGESYILKIDDIEALFSLQTFSIELVAKIKLSALTGNDHYQLSDFSIFEHQFLITGVSRNADEQAMSGVWLFNEVENTITKLHSFDNAKAEGVVVNPQNQQLVVVFDHGARAGSFFTQLPFSSTRKSDF